MPWYSDFLASARVVATRHQLISAGATDRELAAAIDGGHLLRLRRGIYVAPGTPTHTVHALRVGGRLACISALRHMGIFGFDRRHAHIHLRKSASRLRSPSSARLLLTPSNRGGVVLHWRALVDPGAGDETIVGTLDALAQAILCQSSRLAIASIDNALFLGAVTDREVATLFGMIPPRFEALRCQIDGRSEAGQESVLRCAFRAAGLHVEIQVTITGIGRVDMIVEGRLVVEADSRLAHDGWELHVRDRNRDIDVARLGYMSLRPGYNRTMFSTDDVVEAVVSLLAATSRFRTVIP